jgi:hypothetical protein
MKNGEVFNAYPGRELVVDDPVADGRSDTDENDFEGLEHES